MLMRFFDRLPRWLITLIGLILVVGIGIADWLTGDYSVLIIYTIPIFMVSWFAGRWRGVVISVVCGCSRFISNLPLHEYSLINYWNSFGDTLFFLVICLLVSQLRRALD